MVRVVTAEKTIVDVSDGDTGARGAGRWNVRVGTSIAASYTQTQLNSFLAGVIPGSNVDAPVNGDQLWLFSSPSLTDLAVTDQRVYLHNGTSWGIQTEVVNGNLLVNGSVTLNVLDGTSGNIQSSNYVAGTSGWFINGATGAAEFQNATIRGTLNASDLMAGTLNVDRINGIEIATDMNIGNTGVGTATLAAITSGNSNTAFGFQAGGGITSGQQNTIVGYQFFMNATTGSNNTFLGFDAGVDVTTAGGCTFVGSDATTNDADGNNQMAIGHSALATGPNDGVLGNASNTMRIPGTLTVAKALTASTTLGVTGNATVGGTLDVTGNTSVDQLDASDFSTFTVSTATLDTTGNATVGGTLGVTGSSTFTGSITTSDQANLNGSVSATAGFTSSGITTISGTTNLNGATNLGGNLTTNSDASVTLSGGLNVTGAATVTNNFLTCSGTAVNTGIKWLDPAGNSTESDFELTSFSSGNIRQLYLQGDDGSNIVLVTEYIKSNDGVSSTVSLYASGIPANSLGKTTSRWDNIYLANQPNVSSDQNYKQQIGGMTSNELVAARTISGLMKRFKLNEEVTRLGDAKAPFHWGVIAQQIVTAFEDAGVPQAEQSIVVRHDHNLEPGEVPDADHVPDWHYGVLYGELTCFLEAYRELSTPTHTYVQIPGDIDLINVPDGSTLYIDGDDAVDRVVNATDTLRFKPGQWSYYNAQWRHTVSGDTPQPVLNFS